MQIIKKKNHYRLIALPLIALAVLCGTLLLLQRNNTVEALTGWKAGNIMDDYVMANNKTMTASQIQSFLNNKNPYCDTNGTGKAAEFGRPDLTRAQYAKLVGWHAPPYTCLKNYKQNSKSAAQIIYDVAQEFRINPQVLLVLLQKEQSLVTDIWPLNSQYKTATGYGCPDTAPCDSQYFGLTNQLRWASRMFRSILDANPNWYTPYTLGTNYIQYNPNKSCGGSNVYIENRATQALYNYTPYQPNKGALDAGWGTASCGAYGNRNFYKYFTEWFGSTRLRYVSFESPRWMQLNTDTYKRNPETDQVVDTQLAAGTQLKFVTKAYANGKWYYRTEWDNNRSFSKGIPAEYIIEIPYQPFDTPRWMQLNATSPKFNPRTGKAVTAPIDKNLVIYFDSKIVVNGSTFYRTKYSTDTKESLAFPATYVDNLKMDPMEKSRWMRASSDTYAKNLNSATLTNGNLLIKKDTDLFFDGKKMIDNKWYLHAQDVDQKANYIFPLENFRNIDLKFTKLDMPRIMKLRNDLRKQNPETAEPVDLEQNELPKGMEIFFTTKIYVGGQWYLRTKYDTDRNTIKVIPLSELEEIQN